MNAGGEPDEGPSGGRRRSSAAGQPAWRRAGSAAPAGTTLICAACRELGQPLRGGGQIKEKLGALAIYTDERTACQGSTWCRSSPGQRGTVGAAALVAAGEVALEASRPQPGGPLTNGRLGAA